MSSFSAPHFHDADAARRHLEEIRWPDGPVCPHCGESERVWTIKTRSARPGVYKCGNKACRKQFSVTVGTLFERSHVPLNVWFQAAYLLCSSKKGMSAHQLHRVLGVTYKTAWFMAHRLREAMKDGPIFKTAMGGEGKSVQADETYIGRQKDPEPSPQRKGRPYRYRRKGPRGKNAIVGLVSEGQVRTFHVRRANAATVRHILFTNVRRESELHTDESRLYTDTGAQYTRHRTVRHTANEYVGRDGQTTNAIENYFSIFKRGMKGVYQHCAEEHLHRYLGEFDFRYNSRDVDDVARTVAALKGIEGKRLFYRTSAAA